MTRQKSYVLGKRRRRAHREGDRHPLTRAFHAKQARLVRKEA